MSLFSPPSGKYMNVNNQGLRSCWRPAGATRHQTKNTGTPPPFPPPAGYGAYKHCLLLRRVGTGRPLYKGSHFIYFSLFPAVILPSGCCRLGRWRPAGPGNSYLRCSGSKGGSQVDVRLEVLALDLHQGPFLFLTRGDRNLRELILRRLYDCLKKLGHFSTQKVFSRIVFLL